MAPSVERVEILYIGNEPPLSKASSALLRMAGYRVRATNPVNVKDMVREANFEAVILCATLSFQEMDAVVELLERVQPGTPIVSVHVGLMGEGPYPASSAVADALQGPKALISAVESVTRCRRVA